MRDGLCAIQQHAGTASLGQLDHLPRRRDGAERVGDMREGDNSRLLGQQFFVFVQQNLAGSSTGTTRSFAPAFGRQKLPGHDVGMMFEMRDEDLITGFHEALAVGLGDKVDALCGAAHENNLFGRAGIDEAAHRLAGVLIGIGGTRGEFMRGTVDVGVFVLVEIF